MQFFNKENLLIEVGARSSPLSQAQVKEVLDILQKANSSVQFNVHYLSTIGDRDRTTSLRHLEKTDFFTKEIDQWVLEKSNRIGIHSAKDLSDPLREGLTLFCLTLGIDASDSLVLGPHETLESLPSGALIGTSSQRREEMIRSLRDDVSFCDIRGTIEQRLEKLIIGEIKGLVVAEAALIRLKLTHLNRIHLTGSTVEGQGRLAIVGRQEDQELKEFLNKIIDLDIR